MTEEEMIGWHHQFNGHEFEQALGVGDGPGGLVSAVHGIIKSRTQLSNCTYLQCQASCLFEEYLIF